ncbi:hypothetical protein TWF481_007804 [Arthrobotrys musiformis]|uniref:Uncharacterized protein n=1 Tax=Arthrobotrys musiformis TaxID=47236 RepID=A0AAV9W722_9PEZI
MQCTVLEKNGSPCDNRCRANRGYCTKHNAEYQKLYESYKTLEKEYDGIGLETSPPGPPGSGESDSWKIKALKKINCGREVCQQRTEVNHRFFNQISQTQANRNVNWQEGNRSHVQRILKLQSEVKFWEGELEKRDQQDKAFENARRIRPAQSATRMRQIPYPDTARILRDREIAREAREIAREARELASSSPEEQPSPSTFAASLPLILIAIYVVFSL